jgi:hypothetical protein
VKAKNPGPPGPAQPGHGRRSAAADDHSDRNPADRANCCSFTPLRGYNCNS